MPEEGGAGEILSLAADFPPVPTAAWEAAIRADLKGADYEKKLVWRTEEGLAVRPYYRAEDAAGLAPLPLPRPWSLLGDRPGRRALARCHPRGRAARQGRQCGSGTGLRAGHGGRAD